METQDKFCIAAGTVLVVASLYTYVTEIADGKIASLLLVMGFLGIIVGAIDKTNK